MAKSNSIIFKTFFTSMKEPAAFIGQDYKITEVNPAFCGYLGIKRSQAISRHCYKVAFKAKKPCSPCALDEAVKTGLPSTVTHPYQSEKGNTRYIQINAVSLAGQNTVVEIMRDITDVVTLKHDLEEKDFMLEILEKTVMEWADAKTLNDVLEKICGYILKRLGYRMAWVGLIKEGNYDVIPAFSMGFEEGYLSSIRVRYNDSPHGMGPTGMCIKTGQPQIMKDITGDPRFEPWRKEAIKRGYRSSAAIPLVLKGKAIGALNIYSDKPDAFSEYEIELLKTLSAKIVVALEKSMLMETVSKGKKEWEETFDSIANPIFIHDRQYRVIKANRAYIEMAGLSFKEVMEKPYWEIFPKRDGPLSSCKKAVELDDVEPKKVEKIETPSGEIFLSEAFPIYEDKKPVSFVHVITDITKLIKAQERIEEEALISSSLLKLSTDIGKILDIGTIFDEVSRMIMKLISAERTAIFLKQDESEEYRAVAFYGWSEHLIPLLNTLRLRKGDMPAFDMILRGEDVYIENAATSGLIVPELTNAMNLKTLILLPLITGEGVAGAIAAEKDGRFSDKDKAIFKGITSNTAIAVENVRLYKESIELASDLARRMETIRTTYEIDRTILSTLNRREILEVITKNTQRIIPADRIITVQLDEKGNYSYKSEVISSGASTLLDSVVMGGRVASIPNLVMYKHPDIIITDFIREGFGSLMALPLYTKGKRFGCIIMASKRIGAFDKDDISNGEKLTAQVAIALENAKLYEDIKELFLSIIKALVTAVDAKSPWTKGHSERVTGYAILLGKEMGLTDEELERLRLASLLHDIGKIGTYDIVLDKPERLTEEEFELVKKHPGKGVEILGSIKQLQDIAPIIKSHHEKIDGSGYPDGLKADEIPLLAKILCVADSFDSMTADRPYRPAPGKDYAISELKRCTGTQFDPKVVEAFLRVLKISLIPL